ncbi:unnamed protein product [Mycena citricolor]|uniref:Cytochrome P450 n=1 Tax=Mycena citricolor TaxID=2018698 RepID=A0AAD2H7C7_9AGAR|nr:unnamed protein product [Mycena citricolor]
MRTVEISNSRFLKAWAGGARYALSTNHILSMIHAHFTLASAAAAIAFLALHVCRKAARRRTGDIAGLRGPPRESWLFGNLAQLLFSRNYGDYEFQWQESYGDIYVIRGVLGQTRLMVSDPVALNHLLRNDDVHLAPMMLAFNRSLFGRENAMALRDAAHRNLRAALNLGFSPSVIEGYRDHFESVARTITVQFGKSRKSPVMDVIPALSMATLSAISQVTLGQSTEALGKELIQANLSILACASRFGSAQLLAEGVAPYLPASFLDWIFRLPLPMFADIRRAYTLARQVGEQVILESLHTTAGDETREEHLYGRILAQNPRKSLSHSELATQTNLILVAGQDTTTNTVAFALVELARQPVLQDAVRAEISAARARARIQYDSLPLLNACIKEALRLFPAEPVADKIAHVDLTLPLSRPVTLSDGSVTDTIFVPKGQLVALSFAGYQRGHERWGPEPEKFNPYRWIEGKVALGQIDCELNLFDRLSFSNGPHVCLGWRFAIFEMQVILAELISNFVFDLPGDPALEMHSRFANALMPCDATGDRCAWLSVKHVQGDT